MPYIGVAPSSGLFKKLDAITVVNAQAAYTMQYNSSNFKPATAEQLIVSVNGVIQAPTDAYTVSGSTITFSENLVTGDVIDFIVALGEVGNTVTPVDGSVDINKMSSSLMTESGDVTTMKDVLSVDSANDRVGIGTSSPSASLQTVPESGNFNVTYNDFDGVNMIVTGAGTSGNGNYGGAIAFTTVDGSPSNEKMAAISAVQTASDENQVGLAFFTHPSASGAGDLSANMILTHDGNVGIGTTSPVSNMHIDGSSAGQADLRFTDTATGETSTDGLVIGLDSASNAFFWNYENNDLYLGTNNTTRMRIDSDGDVLFNASSAGISNTLSTTIETSDYNNSRITVNHSSSGSSNGSYYMQFGYGGSRIGSITQSSTASIAYNTSSDHRLKENAVDMTGAITRVKSLQPKRFNFIADDTDTLVDGFMAHEAATVVPEAVTGTHNEVDADGNPVYQGIDQSKLVPLLTGALQEAIAKIEALETRVQALEDA